MSEEKKPVVKQIVRAGRITEDGEKKNLASGTALAEAKMVVGFKDSTEWWKIKGWRDDCAKVAALRKGDRVLVCGFPSSNEYNGKTYLEITADFIAVEGKSFTRSDADDTGTSSKPVNMGDEIPDKKMPWDPD